MIHNEFVTAKGTEQSSSRQCSWPAHKETTQHCGLALQHHFKDFGLAN